LSDYRYLVCARGRSSEASDRSPSHAHNCHSVQEPKHYVAIFAMMRFSPCFHRSLSHAHFFLSLSAGARSLRRHRCDDAPARAAARVRVPGQRCSRSDWTSDSPSHVHSVPARPRVSNCSGTILHDPTSTSISLLAMFLSSGVATFSVYGCIPRVSNRSGAISRQTFPSLFCSQVFLSLFFSC